MEFGVRCECWGDWACFTRPELKVERVSYEAMTPSAARGIIEAIYWKPEIRWVIDRITVTHPIRFMSFRRNEVGRKLNAIRAARVMSSSTGDLFMIAREVRQQRSALVLRDVRYIIEAHVDIVSGPKNPTKHLEQFRRRARSGACFMRPYLGCREFPAEFRLLEQNETPIVASGLLGIHDLGRMLHDIDFKTGMTAHYFHARMVDGVIQIPRFPAGQQ